MALSACDRGAESPRQAGGGSGRGTINDFSKDSAMIIEARTMKNQAFRGADSPIPEEHRGSFAGLNYYAPNRALALDVTLQKLDKPEPFSMAATKGDIRMMRRYGRFTFTVDGVPCTLTAFTSEDHPTTLFIPFKDNTNGTETYEVGRYIDMEVNQEGRYQLDFNMAYNPYCAYNPSYTCPIVPAENRLPVAIRAGEKLPPDALAH